MLLVQNAKQKKRKHSWRKRERLKQKKKNADEENETDKWLLITTSDYRSVRMCGVSNEQQRALTQTLTQHTTNSHHKRTKREASSLVLADICRYLFIYIYTTGISFHSWARCRQDYTTYTPSSPSYPIASGELIKSFNCVRPLKRKKSVGIFCCFQFNCRNLHQNCGQKFSFFRTSDNPLHIQKSTSNWKESARAWVRERAREKSVKLCCGHFGMRQFFRLN